MEKIVTLKNLCKKYGKQCVLDVTEVEFAKGKIYGIIGPNGAGKTTMFKLLAGLIQPTSGDMTFFEGRKTPQEARKKISFMIENPYLDLGMTAAQNMNMLAILYDAEPKNVEKLLKLVGLGKTGKKKVKNFSLGMKQRLGIAQALLNDPRILILDEPTAGLDPKERVRFRNLISSLAENRIVILSTHIVSDVEYIANEILIMKNGELIQHGSPEKLLKPIEKCVWECDVSRKEAEELELNYVTANLKHNNGAERLRIISQEAPCRTAWNVDPTLEDLYLYYFAEVSEHE